MTEGIVLLSLSLFFILRRRLLRHAVFFRDVWVLNHPPIVVGGSVSIGCPELVLVTCFLRRTDTTRQGVHSLLLLVGGVLMSWS